MQINDSKPVKEVLEGTDLILVDNCYLTFNNNLAHQLFDVRTPLDLVAVAEPLERERYELLWKLNNVIRDSRTFTVEEIVKHELSRLLDHLQEVYNFSRCRTGGKREARRSPGRRTKSRSFDHQDFAEEAGWDSSTVREAMQSLNSYSLAVQQVQKEFKIYAGKCESVRDRSWKASETDYHLVESVLGFVGRDGQKKAAILTSDFDIPYILSRNKSLMDKVMVFFPELTPEGIINGRNLRSIDYEADYETYPAAETHRVVSGVSITPVYRENISTNGSTNPTIPAIAADKGFKKE